MDRPLALISVYDKTNIIEFCTALSTRFKFVATGNTTKHLREGEVEVQEVSSLTNFPEILDGQVKTLHPTLIGGILGRTSQNNELSKFNIIPIGMVVVNLYPFSHVTSRSHEVGEALDNIDIGGVTLLRAGAKNYQEVIPVCSVDDYPWISKAIINGSMDLELRKSLARKAFGYTAGYDVTISNYFNRMADDPYPDPLIMSFENPQELRYGENWHQNARYYLLPGEKPFFVQLHGRKVSLNNLVDFYAVMGLFSEHSDPSCAIIKHTSPCGFASAPNIETAFDDAFATDNLSAFGSAMGFNRPITVTLAEKLNRMFVDAIIAPDFDSKAFGILAQKERIVLCKFNDYKIPSTSIRFIPNGVLVQPTDTRILTAEDLKVVSRVQPTTQEFQDLNFAWKVGKYVKSNSAVISIGTKTVGVGMGQTSRIGAVDLAIRRAGTRAKGSVLASDAFFPFRDCVDAAAEAGITAIIAPGGSIRDTESIAAADEHEIALVWSGVRAFLH
ncbi:MAG: bifunctional phosphoribosylaminoimidazolecarboxamide formyltransferase/IMP cyclohydrolase [Candidatus Heimdallarchaeota archaeon]